MDAKITAKPLQKGVNVELSKDLSNIKHLKKVLLDDICCGMWVQASDVLLDRPVQTLVQSSAVSLTGSTAV